MKRIILLLTSMLPCLSQAQSYEPCLVEIVTLVKDLKFAEARKIYHSGDCSFQYKDEFGEKVKVDQGSVKSFIDLVDRSEKACQRFKGKPKVEESDLKTIASTCGSSSKLGINQKLQEAEKYSGVPVTEFAKRWDAFIDETRSGWEKKEQDEELTEQKYQEQKVKEADSPEGWRQRTCQTHNLIQMAQNVIKKEKAGAKHSGIVDKNRLYEAGQAIENYGATLERQKVEYKKRSGKDWSPSLCK